MQPDGVYDIGLQRIGIRKSEMEFENLMVIISLELTRVNPDRNIFSINVELTSTFLLYREGPSPSLNFKST